MKYEHTRRKLYRQSFAKKKKKTEVLEINKLLF